MCCLTRNTSVRETHVYTTTAPLCLRVPSCPSLLATPPFCGCFQDLERAEEKAQVWRGLEGFCNAGGAAGDTWSQWNSTDNHVIDWWASGRLPCLPGREMGCVSSVWRNYVHITCTRPEPSISVLSPLDLSYELPGGVPTNLGLSANKQVPASNEVPGHTSDVTVAFCELRTYSLYADVCKPTYVPWPALRKISCPAGTIESSCESLKTAVSVEGAQGVWRYLDRYLRLRAQANPKYARAPQDGTKCLFFRNYIVYLSTRLDVLDITYQLIYLRSIYVSSDIPTK